MSDSPEVGDLLAAHEDGVAATAHRLRRVLLDGCPGLVERVRPGWHSLNYHDPAAGFVCAVFPQADRVQLVFERGALLPDPEGLLSGSGRTVRTLDFTDEASVDAAVVLGFLDAAIEIGAVSRTARRA